MSDCGPGISEVEHAHIFTMFGQGLRNHAGKGLGIGLYLVQKIVELHGGSVSLKTRLEGGGTGSTFTVQLPLDVSERKLEAA